MLELVQLVLVDEGVSVMEVDVDVGVVEVVELVEVEVVSASVEVSVDEVLEETLVVEEGASLVVDSAVSRPPVTWYAAAHSTRSIESGQHQVWRVLSWVQ